MKAELKHITPAEADAMLAKSIGNRSIREAKVQSYGRDMAAGKWVANGEPIIFDITGTLIDGHHRLKACAKSGQSFLSLVVTGAPVSAAKTIDIGAARTPSDVLAFHGYKNTTQLNAVVRIIMSIRAGVPNGVNPSVQEIFQFIEDNPGVEDSAMLAASRIPVSGVQNMIGAIHFIAGLRGNQYRVHEFRHVLMSGVPAYNGCPAHALRERLFRAAAIGKPLLPKERLSLILSAWNKFAIGATVRILRAGEFTTPGIELVKMPVVGE